MHMQSAPPGEHYALLRHVISNVLHPFADHVFDELNNIVNGGQIVIRGLESIDHEVFRSFDIRLSHRTPQAAKWLVTNQISRFVEWAWNNIRINEKAANPNKNTIETQLTEAGVDERMLALLGDDPVASACTWWNTANPGQPQIDIASIPKCDEMALVRISTGALSIVPVHEHFLPSDDPEIARIGGTVSPMVQRFMTLTAPLVDPRGGGDGGSVNIEVRDFSWADKILETLRGHLETIHDHAASPWEQGLAFQKGLSLRGSLADLGGEYKAAADAFEAAWRANDNEQRQIVGAWWTRRDEQQLFENQDDEFVYLDRVQDALMRWHVELFQDERGKGVHLEPLRTFTSASADAWRMIVEKKVNKGVSEEAPTATLEDKARVLFARIHVLEMRAAEEHNDNRPITKRHVVAAFTTRLFDIAHQLVTRGRFEGQAVEELDANMRKHMSDTEIYVACALAHGCIEGAPLL